MKMFQYIANFFILCSIVTITGCSSQTHQTDKTTSCSNTADSSTYYYQPLNPMTIWISSNNEDNNLIDATSDVFKQALLNDLDTETVRISMDSYDGEINAQVGIGQSTISGKDYTLVVDYIKYFAGCCRITTSYPTNYCCSDETKFFNENIPVYLGIGLRIRAEFTALEEGVTISGLPSLAIAANAGQINGRLTVQTLGISGQEITNLIPIISDISMSSIQSALQSAAAIKAKINDKETIIYPKIIGFESPHKDPALIKAITRSLYEKEINIIPQVSNITIPENKTQISILWQTQDSNAKSKCIAPAEQSAHNITIVSLVPNPKGDEMTEESITLKNHEKNNICLDGWFLQDESGKKWDLSGNIDAGKLLTIKRNKQEMSLNNNGDIITLLDPKGSISCSIYYEKAKEGETLVIEDE